MAVDIFVARHGQNVDNANDILNGHRDLPLTDLGRKQAHQLGRQIKELGLVFTGVYSSPLSRALETARIVCQELGITAEPIILPELIERDFGVMTGVPAREIDARCGADVLKTATVSYFLSPEGAETFPQLIARGRLALERVRSLQASGNALLVCHGDLGKMMYAADTGKPWDDVLRSFHFGNGDLIEINPTGNAHLVQLPQYN